VPEGSEDENRKPETGDQGGKHPLRAQPAKMTFGRVERRQLSVRAAVARFRSRSSMKAGASSQAVLSLRGSRRDVCLATLTREDLLVHPNA
jgi:hypothetical protein